ncbi:GNAT family N-acetyltransferase [Neorhizobium sp. NCHU2750]|uniref:GNAT family N-acetyltransferase n=1 Tax=Neorhizobium sp. NCHU2750 TaxID=1825976 RepID=UPI000E75C432|nr:GCN5 family acetyltransferase [Neorhizobium sp. NCHU2750]
MNIPKTLYVDAFEMRYVDITEIELPKLQALSISVGWPHRAADWQHARDVGHGFAALDEIGRVSASTMWFPHGDTFATFGMLITSPRLQANGTARWLMERMLAECPGRDIRLNSTREARRLYASFGFRPQRTVFQCQGEAINPPAGPTLADGLTVRRLDRSDLDAVVTLDAPAFGAERGVHIHRLFDSSIGYGLYDGDRLLAYSMRRRFGRGHVVGPIVASCDADAIAVTHPQVAAHVGNFLRIDLRFDTGDFANFVQQSGMSVYDTVKTMVTSDKASYGESDGGQPIVYGMSSQSFG